MDKDLGYKFYLPNENRVAVEHASQINSVIIIGANGAGKTRLGEWIEKNEESTTHRIGAQRSLLLDEFVEIKSFEQATNSMVYGSHSKEFGHGKRWGGINDYATAELKDYKYILSALIALKNKQQEKYLDLCRKLDKKRLNHPPVPETVVDVFQRIWNYIFPQRKVRFKDSKVMAEFMQGSEKLEYSAKNMSDGERVALYIISQVLCLPNEISTIIVDEPELHLHRSIMNKLWTSLERERNECVFIYITHDTQFAASHESASTVWVKSYDGVTWDLEIVKESELPEQTLLDILGNRKPVIFVEGTAESYDTKLYSEIYKNYYIVPCGGCSQVISQTKAMKQHQQLHHLHSYGIVDRDYRSDNEIKKLKKDGIYVLEVAEVENLFLVEEVLFAINEILGNKNNSSIRNVKNYIISDQFANQINRQICEAVVTELKYMLSSAEILKKSEEDAKESLEKLYDRILFESAKQEKEAIFTNALKSKNYALVLKVFNCKSLLSSIGEFFNIRNSKYSSFVLKNLKNENSAKIVKALLKYIPKEVPVI